MTTDTSFTTASIADETAADMQSASTTPSPLMPSTAKVAVNFINTSNDTDLIVAASRIVNAMTGNTRYPTPVPTLAAVTTARDALLAVVNTAVTSKLTLATRRQLRPPLVTLLRQLAQYVQTTSNGDPVVLIGSGFPIHRPRQLVGVLPAPANLRLSPGLVSGQLRARCKLVAQAASYQWRIATTKDPTAWLPADPTVAANASLRDLSPGTQYVVQVRAIGTKGPSDWSNAATQISM
ncbi:MAG TPA: hypothetical protein VK660_10060 [Xanthomonadaceae bacterium]|jgi:hypothetical protein|nr:hypothetical protein [Xanthomonadaceae bacterium]